VFTALHEVVGHGILHGKFLRETGEEYPNLHSTEKSMSLIENTFEHQANQMATNFICPEGLVRALYWKLFRTRRKINYVGPGEYCLNVNGKSTWIWAASPHQLAWAIVKRLKHYFWGLSSECLIYQILQVAIDSNGFCNKDFSHTRNVDSIGDSMQ
jgi:hypothetical protein